MQENISCGVISAERNMDKLYVARLSLDQTNSKTIAVCLELLLG